MKDNFFGGEPYGGRQIVYHKGAPVWLCVYYGRVHDTLLTPDEVYDFLREALQHPIEDKPFRGPNQYAKNNLEYRNEVSGDTDKFSGGEAILENNVPIYEATYLGGLVDVRSRGSS